jgi:hypothetical protein
VLVAVVNGHVLRNRVKSDSADWSVEVRRSPRTEDCIPGTSVDSKEVGRVGYWAVAGLSWVVKLYPVRAISRATIDATERTVGRVRFSCAGIADVEDDP